MQGTKERLKPLKSTWECSMDQDLSIENVEQIGSIKKGVVQSSDIYDHMGESLLNQAFSLTQVKCPERGNALYPAGSPIFIFHI